MYFFDDRRDAGRQLGARLARLKAERPVVLGLPRGGVPVAAEVARALDAPLDVLIVRKLGLPAQPELGMGAIGEHGTRVLNQPLIEAARVTARELAAVEQQEREELARRAERFRGGREMTSVRGRSVVLVDDGLATGGTARAAVATLRMLGASRIVLAVPIASDEAARSLAEVVDAVVVVHIPRDLRSIGQYYADFTQTTDAEVVAALEASRTGDGGARAGTDEDVSIPISGGALAGHLTVPAGARGLVLFAHGSGSSRHSPRNVAVARRLHAAGLGTLLFDLLTESEARDRANVFDVSLLARRLLTATTWVRDRPDCEHLAVGYFGASTGAAAALIAAAAPAAGVAAVVSRGGRPDLAMAHLGAVRAPTLLIVGGDDHAVLEANRAAAARLGCPHRVDVVPGASHLFEEPGTLEQAAALAAAWFVRHLELAAADGNTAPARR
jgi:predicted phosphoribosyltransferase/dienelactone hydrolase